MIIRNYIERIQELYSKGVPADSSRLSSRYVYSKLATTRALFITRTVNKNSIISSWDKTFISKIELIDAPVNECHNIRSNCKIKRSKYPIPSIITANTFDVISVKSLDGTIKYSRTTWDKAQYLIGAKYTATKPTFYVRNNFIYVLNSRADYIAVEAIFEDVIEAFELNMLCNPELACMSYKDVEFDVPSELMDVVIQETAKELIEWYIRYGREDITVNSTDTPINEAK